MYDKGRRVSSGSFTLFGLPNSLEHCRLGITVTRKVGGAVRRNRIKRVLREIFRRNRERLAPPIDVVVNAHPGLERRTMRQLEEEFLNRFSQLARGFPS